MKSEAEKICLSRLAGCQMALQAFISAAMPDLPGDVGDVVQETNLRVIETAAKYNPARPFRPWLFAFAVNQIKAHRTRKSRESLLFGDEYLQEIADFSLARPEMETAEALRRLELCRAKLSPKHRRLLEMRYDRNMAVKEIARKLGANPHTVTTTLSFIRGKLAACVRGMCEVKAAEDGIAARVVQAEMDVMLKWAAARAPKRRYFTTMFWLCASCAAAGTIWLAFSGKGTPAHEQENIEMKRIVVAAASVALAQTFDASAADKTSSARSQAISLEAVGRSSVPAEVSVDNRNTVSAQSEADGLNTHPVRGTIVYLL